MVTRLNEPEFYGRMVGGVFTTYATTGGRLGRRILSGKAKARTALANHVLATTGAMILSIKYGGRDVVSVIDAAITGDYSPEVSGRQFKEIFRDALGSDIEISQEEQDALTQILDGVLDCLHYPEKYVGGIEENPVTKPATQHVPIGTVSSARLPRQMGTIPRGEETNTIDVLSEMEERSRR